MCISFIIQHDFYFLMCNFAKFTFFQGTFQISHFLMYATRYHTVTVYHATTRYHTATRYLAATSYHAATRYCTATRNLMALGTILPLCTTTRYCNQISDFHQALKGHQALWLDNIFPQCTILPRGDVLQPGTVLLLDIVTRYHWCSPGQELDLAEHWACCAGGRPQLGQVGLDQGVTNKYIHI